MITVAAYPHRCVAPHRPPPHTPPCPPHNLVHSCVNLFHLLTISAVDYVLRPEGRELLLSPWTCLKLFKRTYRRW